MNRMTAVISLLVVTIFGIMVGGAGAYLSLAPNATKTISSLSGGLFSSQEATGDVGKLYTQNLTDVSTAKLTMSSVRNLGWALCRSLNIPLYSPNDIKSLKGMQFNSAFNVTIPGGQENTEVSVNINSKNYFNGGSRNDITIKKPDFKKLSRVKLYQANNQNLVIFPKSKEYHKSKNKTLGDYSNKVDNFFNYDEGQLNKSNASLDGRSVYELDIQNQKNSKIFVSQSPPHTVHKISFETDDGSGRRSLNISYKDPEQRQYINKITSNSPNQSSISMIKFNYDGTKISNIQFQPPEPSAKPFLLDFNHGSKFSSGFDGHLQDSSNNMLKGRWDFNNRFPTNTSLELNFPIKNKNLTAEVSLKDIKWHRQTGSIDLSAPSEFKKLEAKEVKQKVMRKAMPLMFKAMSIQRQFSQ